MSSSTIHVQYRDGSTPTGARVVLGFSSGMTQAGFTDRHGVATVEHSSTGRADVYVSGRKYHSFHAPGHTTVTIS